MLRIYSSRAFAERPYVCPYPSSFAQVRSLVYVHPQFPLLNAYVEMVRFELMTPCLQGRCSPN